MYRKLLQAIIISLIVLVLPTIGNLQVLKSFQIWILVLIGLTAILFQPSYNPFKKASSQDKGTAAQIVWSIYITQFITVLEAAYLRFPQSLEWDLIAFIALAIMLFGLFLRTWAVFILGKQFTMHITAQPNQHFVTKGPFRYMRHPSYTGALFTYVFSAVFLHAWFSVAINLVVLMLAYLRRMHHEENMLKKDFGKEYIDYCSKVKKLIPGIW